MIRLALACLIGLGVTAARAGDDPGRIVFVNQTGQRIIHLYEECYGVTDCDWDDLLGPDVLQPGASARAPLNSPQQIGGCLRAYRAELEDLSVVRLDRVDSCRPNVVTFGPTPAR
ncbi:MAG: hypothetical protein K1X35_13120 [Caulobacteraceae bacterium]|nr:hypothetical protein [Caulobacteraceae bacterium]